jgi:glycosyltransferase involved in cell wall biosynthesis
VSLPPGGVWLDVRGTQSAAHGERGIARFIAEQTKSLLEIAPEAIGAVGLDPGAPVPPFLRELDGVAALRTYAEPPAAPPAIHHVMSPFESNLGLDVIWPQWARTEATRTVVTLYDLIPLILRDEYLAGSWSFWGTVWTARLGLIRAADQVLTISERTAADATEHLGISPERITVIDSGVSADLAALAPNRERAEEIAKGISRRLRPDYLLYVGGDDPRKNLEGLIRAYALLSPELRAHHQLVIVCRLTKARQLQLLAFARGLGVSARDVLLTGFVTEEQLSALYRACGLFVFPSLYEGAGLPVLEAMSCDAPVAASFSSAIPEILGDSQATFNPADPHDIARALAEVLPSERAIEALRERSRRRVGFFTWTRVAEKSLAGYERALAAPAGRRRFPKPPAPAPGRKLGAAQRRPTAALPRGGVWIDAQGTQNVVHGERGIARFAAEHTKALIRVDREALGQVRLDPALPVPPSLEELRGTGLLEDSSRSPNGSGAPAIHHVMSPIELTVPFDDIFPRWSRHGSTRTVVTLHDLIPLLFREDYLDHDPELSARYFARLGLVRGADHVLTNSERTAADAVEHLGVPESKVTVIGCGVSPQLAALVPDRSRALELVHGEHPEIREGFLLYVGGDDSRKNLDGAVRAFALLTPAVRRAHQLVIVCALTPARIEELKGLAGELGVASDELVFTGFQPDPALSALYRACGLFVFPSLYEGAGLPVLEAMSCGAPVAASATSSIPEILGDLDATFEPSRPESIAQTVEGVLTSPERLEALRERSARQARSFTWERVAERTIEGYERALATPRARRPRRKRVAVLTPWPPLPSGVATHSRRLIEALSAHAEIDVIAPATPGITYDRSLEPRVRLLGDPDFAWAEAVRDYDRLLYALGSSPFHTSAFELLMDQPGTALIHDVRLVGLYVPLFHERRRTDPAWLERKVVELYGERFSPQDLRRAWDPEVYVRNGIFMTQEVQARAEGILVHSRYASDVLRTEAPDPAPSVDIVSHGVPVPPTAGEGSRGGGEGPLIVSYGAISLATKRTALLLDAFAELRRRRTSARLVLVGGVDARERAAVERMAGGLGVSDALEIRGRADDRDYWGILRAADLAVQLRTGAGGGEASGAVCDCIAARVPTIVSDIGWFGELPEPVVVAVPEDCDSNRLATEMEDLIGAEARRGEIRAAQDEYAKANSFARVAERYAELLSL